MEIEVLRLHFIINAGVELESGGRGAIDVLEFESLLHLLDDEFHIRFTVF